ncbi:hypothetical protein POM88_019762 [Heracleum sosnowskyi]|uniref:TF-B3 domain-containing protein n=1 Tax=Heracleum sosnowskyi TaxID=360622 RepID=A0AAD8IA50_9APIA|nr:hypothetical protein POM88_019762 [Heracleum sosnowskyi]
MGFLCKNSGITYLYGKITLPGRFLEGYGKEIPKTVYLHIRSRRIWRGLYVQHRKWIEGLDDMMRYYGVKPYHLVAFTYNGGSSFDVEIFNPYAVEVNYTYNPALHVEDEWFMNLSDIDVEKLWSCFSYNAYENLTETYDLVICKRTLKRKNYIQEFAEAAKLRVGDICVLRSTEYCQFFRVAVIEKRSVSQYNTSGIEQRKSMMKFFRVINLDTVITGELELPRLFLQKYGACLSEEVTIVMVDGFHLTAKFFKGSKLLYRSTFYTTIYNEHCMDICNGMRHKLLLVDVIEQLEEEVMVLENINDHVGVIGMEEPNTTVIGEHSYFVEHDLIYVQNNNLHLQMVVENVEGGEYLNSFTVKFSKSHVDQKGHGVYYPRTLLHIYKNWKNGTTCTLIYNGQSWTVDVHRKKKMCRFGKGWDKFTYANEFTEGQTMRFAYQEEYEFEVTMLN